MMKRFQLSLLVLAFVGVAYAQEPPAPPGAEPSPTLVETLEWIKGQATQSSYLAGSCKYGSYARSGKESKFTGYFWVSTEVLSFTGCSVTMVRKEQYTTRGYDGWLTPPVRNEKVYAIDLSRVSPDVLYARTYFFDSPLYRSIDTPREFCARSDPDKPDCDGVACMSHLHWSDDKEPDFSMGKDARGTFLKSSSSAFPAFSGIKANTTWVSGIPFMVVGTSDGYIDRVIRAWKHAITLCGGRKEPF